MSSVLDIVESFLYIRPMITFHKEQESTNEIKRRRSASRNGIIVVVLLFGALMAGSSVSTQPGEAVGARGIAWITLSVIALLVLLWSIFTSYRQADERQQLMQLKAAALAFMAVMFSLFVAQLFHAVNLINLAIAAQGIFIGGVLLWNLFLWAADRRKHS